MSSARRGRPSQTKDDASEERHLWQAIYEAMKGADEKLEKANKNHARIMELEKIISLKEANGESYPIEAGRELDKLLRENISGIEDLSTDVGIEEEPPHGSIAQQLEILIALRGETDNAPPAASRASSSAKAGRNPKRAKLDIGDGDRDSIAADSPGGPSPKVTVPTGAASRLLKQGGASRSGSVPAAREPSVKTEDGDADVLKAAATPTPSTSTVASASASAPSTSTAGPSERLKLTVGAEVFYRNSPRPTPRGKPSSIAAPLEQPEGEGILCSVTSVIGEGKQRRYEIRDIDDSLPTPPQPYRASVSALVSIPPPEMNEKLPSLSSGKQVLALYPSTTTFYKAEVVTPKDKSEAKKGWVRLRFEGEDEAEKEQEVERRYVLPDSVK
ncbi:hypothetical protein NA57DRAFT_71661 [Rhizodiscina lignyota]|uniref:SGF29 C-terminal domain-containing protein n=1 Tax=Rhizodiscina lignyota TaxID=1504668 RepID=A0A9P4M9D4_9PEZI|nr:hypothetical protein NA57DRAFT_71661 [Rhizodiscina lignyota]